MTTRDALMAEMPAPAEAPESGSAFAGFVQHFEFVARHGADRVAVSWGDRRVSYGELDRRAETCARRFEQSGCREETIVAICCDRSLTLITSLLGVIKARAAFLPLDPHAPAERLRTLVRQSGARLVVTHARHKAIFAACGVEVVVTAGEDEAAADATGAVGATGAGWGEDALARGAAEARPVDARRAPDPASLAYVIYTSGSTGVPKGVAVAQDSFYRYLSWAVSYYGFDPDGVSIVHTSTGVDLTLTSIFCPLLLGMRIVLVSDDEGVEGATRLLANETEHVALLKLTPSHLLLMASAGPATPGAWRCDVLIVGGEQLTAGALKFWERQCPGSRVFNEYGPTEATVGCCVAPVQAGTSGADAAMPIGNAIRDVTLRIEAPRAAPASAATPAPTSGSSTAAAEGELFIGGAALARGYLDAPAATAERFLPDPDGHGARCYRTGDWVASGAAGLSFMGRRDRQLKISGVRVELGEVEAVLREYPGVRAATALAVREADGKDRLLAFITLADPEIQALEASSLIRWLRTRVVDAAVPSEFYLVNEPAIALSGKMDHQRLIRQRHTYVRIVDRFVPPQNPTEELLASLWRAVLDVQEIGIDDSFFALDGNSMKAIQFAYGAKKHGLTLSTRDLFERPTIRQLARLVAASPNAPAAPAVSTQPFDLVDPADRARMPDDIVDAYPLTMLQAGTILESTRRAGSGTYHNVNSYHLECELDAASIEAGLERAARRHPILRTCYDYVSYREPLQLVSRAAKIPLHIEDITHLSDEEQVRYIDAFIDAESRTTFDWTRPPLLRFFLHWRGPRRLQLTLSKHHSILDGWSAATLLAEIATHAMAVARRQAPPSETPLETTYRDYVALERQAMSAEPREFWRRTLEGAPCHALQASSGRQPRPDGPVRPVTRPLAFGADVRARLNAVATRAGTPFKSVLLAIHCRVLAQMVGSPDLVTGVVTHGRPETVDADKAIGLFINTVPYRLTIEERFTWIDFIQRVFHEERRVHPYQRYPMARIKKDAGWDRLFDSVFYHTHFHVFHRFRNTEHFRCVDAAGFEETEIPFTSAFSLHPLTGDLSLRLHFAAEIFSAARIEHIAGYFERAIAAVAANADQPVLATQLLGEAELAAAMDAPVETSRARPACPVSTLFLERARQHPERVALSGGDRQLTYDGLRRQVERLRAMLAQRGVGPGSIVGILESDVSHAIALMLAVNRSGACFVILDPQWPDARLAGVVSRLSPALIVANRDLIGRLPAASTPIVDAAEHHRPHAAVAPAASAAAAAAERHDHDLDHLAYIIFTSGSSGAPKGVQISHRNLFHSTQTRLAYYEPGYERFLLLSRLTFDSSFAGIWGTLCGGGTLCVLDQEALLDVGQIFATIRDEAITHLLAIPSLYRVLCPEFAAAGGGSLRAVILAGEELTHDVVHAHRTQLPAVSLYNEYGPSEAAVWATVADLSDATDDGPVVPTSIGRAIAHVETAVLDAGMRPIAPGVTGELYLGGVGIGQGYYGAARLTAARFVPNPRAAHEQGGRVLYRTGDLVRRGADGDLQFVGRTDNQVKVRGFRIELEEIERVFCESFAVRDAMAAIDEPAPGRKRICLLYVLPHAADGSGSLDLSEVRARLGRRLPAYSLPDEIVEVERLPRLPNYKLDRKAAEALRPRREEPTESVEPPSSEVEQVLAEMWRETLGLPAVGIHQSFFEVGGDSLLANQVVLKTEKVFGVKIPLKAFFQTPTIAANAVHLTGMGAALGVDFERVASIWNGLSE